jgi:hypothetical protein
VKLAEGVEGGLGFFLIALPLAVRHREKNRALTGHAWGTQRDLKRGRCACAQRVSNETKRGLHNATRIDTRDRKRSVAMGADENGARWIQVLNVGA